MKSLFSFTILILVLASCAQSTYDIGMDGSNEGRFITGTVVRPLVTPDKNDTGYVNLSYQFYAKKDSLFKDSIHYFIGNYVQALTEFEGEEVKDELSANYFEAQADSFVLIYDGQVALYLEDDSYEIGGVWDLESDISIDDDYTSFIALTISEWSYTGGAHGNGAYTIHMFNRSDGGYLELSDFFTDINELNKICDPYFRDLIGVSLEDNLADAGYWFDDDKFAVNNNFSFNGDELTFYFNTYEISDYATGPTDLGIPISKIKHLLKRGI